MKIKLIVIAGFLMMGACRSGGYRKNQSHADVDDGLIARGDTLAAKYCASCHQLPEPDQLDAGSWANGVLPQMGPRLGIFTFMNQRYPNNIGDPNVGRTFYPGKPAMSEEDWKAIVAYYTSLAPDSLPPQQREAQLQPDTALFRIEPAAGRPGTPPATCFIRYEPEMQRVLTSDVLSHTLEIWDRGGVRTDSLLIGGSIVDIAPDGNGYFACNMGPFGPNNAPAGHIDQLPVPPKVFAAGRPLVV
ncbi:MAG TPA: cytochrome c, partial [Puia sp.]|nr:cytochrome c [Puia sp.]